MVQRDSGSTQSHTVINPKAHAGTGAGSQGQLMFSEAINYFYLVSKASMLGKSGSPAPPQAFAPNFPPSTECLTDLGVGRS